MGREEAPPFRLMMAVVARSMPIRLPVVLELLSDRFGICRLEAAAPVPDWVPRRPLTSITRTDDELSIVCDERSVPEGVACERGWRCAKVQGPLAFTLTGVVSSLTVPLAAAGIGVFVISTYDTDYLLVKDDQLERATAAWTTAGHTIEMHVGAEHARQLEP